MGNRTNNDLQHIRPPVNSCDPEG